MKAAAALAAFVAAKAGAPEISAALMKWGISVSVDPALLGAALAGALEVLRNAAKTKAPRLLGWL